MAKIRLTQPPRLAANASYPRYRSWLLSNFRKGICSYCLQQNSTLDIDHYVPKEFDPTLLREPSNLLPACRACNGPAGKWDYHPLHVDRKKLPTDTSGFLPINVRNEDIGLLFNVDRSTGKLSPKPGPSANRAAWNISLLRLDLPDLDEKRQSLVEALDNASFLITKMDDPSVSGPDKTRFRSLLRTALKQIHEHRLFYIILDINIPADVLRKIQRHSPKPKAKAAP